MGQKFTADELNAMDHEAKNNVICQMQDRLDKLEHDYENLMEQVRLANQQRFGRHTEKLDGIAGQLSLFNEAEACFDEQEQEPMACIRMNSCVVTIRVPCIAAASQPLR